MVGIFPYLLGVCLCCVISGVYASPPIGNGAKRQLLEHDGAMPCASGMWNYYGNQEGSTNKFWCFTALPGGLAYKALGDNFAKPEACAVGLSSDQRGGTNGDDCNIHCQANEYSLKRYSRVDCPQTVASVTCIDHHDQSYCKIETRTCERCPNGWWKPYISNHADRPDVDAVEAGAQVDGNPDLCTPPDLAEIKGGESNCDPCPPGTTREGNGAVCISCPIGKYENTATDRKDTAVQSTTICESCDIGYTSIAGKSASSHDDACTSIGNAAIMQTWLYSCNQGWAKGNNYAAHSMQNVDASGDPAVDANGNKASVLTTVLQVFYPGQNCINSDNELNTDHLDASAVAGQYVKTWIQNPNGLFFTSSQYAAITSSDCNGQRCFCCPVPAGWFSAGTYAQKCPAGQYSPQYGSLSCITCEQGKYAETEGSSTCTSCPDGRVSNGEGAQSIAECCRENAEFDNGLSKCACKKDFYQTQEDTDFKDPYTCNPCPSNMNSPADSKSIMQCHCKPGHGYSSIINGCKMCDEGKTSAQTFSPCIDCQPGTYQDQKGQSQCIRCEHGKYTNQVGRTADCEECTSGKYVDDAYCYGLITGGAVIRTGVDIDECENWNTPGGASGSECHIRECVDEESDCQDCEAGKQSVNAAEACTFCLAGTGNDNAGGTCTPCDIGKYSISTKTSGRCKECPEHHKPSENQDDCEACELGKTYDVTKDQVNCVACADGYFQIGDDRLGDFSSEIGCFGCNHDTSNKYMDSDSTCKLCPNGKYTTVDSGILGVDACFPCKSCDPQQYRTGCTLNLATSVASAGSCADCESCANDEDGSPRKRVGCINQQGHNDAKGACVRTEFVTRTPLCPYHEYNDDWEIQKSTQFGLGGFMFTEVFGRDENHTDFQCRLPCDGTRFPDFDTGYCAGPFACNVPSCTMQSDDDVAGLTNLEARGCPKEDIVDGDSHDAIRDKMRGECETCEDCFGRGCARECSQLKCEVGEIWDFSEARVRNKCKSCQELRDPNLCQDGFSKSHLLATDISGNRPKFEFTDCRPKSDTNTFIDAVTHYQIGYGNCESCDEEDIDKCNTGEYHASCDSVIGCLLCHPHGGVEVMSSEYRTTEGVDRPLYCQVAACANTELTGVDEWGVFCGTECEAIECEESETTLPCLLPHPKRCKAAYPVQRAGQTKVGNVPAHANVLERKDSDHLFSNFENLLMPLSSTLSEDLHQCVWNVMGITDNDMNPGGVAHSFLPHSEVFASNQLSDGTKFCHPWSERNMEVEYPLLPLQNTVTDTASTFQRRVLVNTSARVMDYRYSGDGYKANEFNVPDVIVAPAFTSEFTGDFFLDLDVTKAPRASLAVFIPDDRILNSVDWVPQWELSVLVRESTDVSGLPELTLTLDVGSLESKMTIDLSLFEKTAAGRYVHGVWVHDFYNNVFPRGTRTFSYSGTTEAVPRLFSYSGSLTAYVLRDKVPSDYTRSTLPEFMDLGIVHARVRPGDHSVDVSIESIRPGVITSMVKNFGEYPACYSMEHRVSCLKTDNTFEECIGVSEVDDGHIIQSMTIWNNKLMVTKHRWRAGILTSKSDFYDTSCAKDTTYSFPKPRVLATLGTAAYLWTLEKDSDRFIRLKSYTENSFNGATGFEVVDDIVITENMEYAMQVKDLDLTSIVLCAVDGKVFTLIPVKSSSSDTGNNDEIVLLARMYSESGVIQTSTDIVVDATWSFYEILQGHTSYTSRVWHDSSPLIIGFLGEVYEIDYSSETFAISRIPSSHLKNRHFMKISSGFIAFDSGAVVAPVSDTCKSGFTQVDMDRTITSTLYASYDTERCAHECFIDETCKAYSFEAGECRHVSSAIQKNDDNPHRSACKRLETSTTKELYTIPKSLAHASSTAQFTALLRGFSKLAESGDEAIGYHAVLGEKQDNYCPLPPCPKIEYRVVPYVTLYNGDDVVIQWDPDDSNHEWPDRIFGIQSNFASEIRFFEHSHFIDQSGIYTLYGRNYAEFKISAETFVIVFDLCASGVVQLYDDTGFLRSLVRASSSCDEEYAVIYGTPAALKVYNPAVAPVTTGGGDLRIRIRGDGKIIQMFGVDSMTDFDLRQLKNVNSKGESKGITNTWKRQYRHIPGNLVRGNPKPFPVFLHIDGGSEDQRSVSLDALQMRPVLTVSGTEDVGGALLTNFYLPTDSELGELGLGEVLTGDDVSKWKRLHITVGVDRGDGCRVSLVEVDESGSEVPGNQGMHSDRLKELGCMTEQGHQCHLEVPYSFRDANTKHSVGLKVNISEECDATNIEAWIAPLTTLWECVGESFWSEDEKKCQECVTDVNIDKTCNPGEYVPGCDALMDLTQTGCEDCPGIKNELNEWALDKICILECIDGVSFEDNNGVCTACSGPLTQVDCGDLDPETKRGRRVQECSKTEDAKCVLCDEIQKSIFSSNEIFVADMTGNTVCNTTCRENFYRDLTSPYYCRPCQELDTLQSELSLQREDDTFYRFRKCGKFKRAEFQKCEVVCDTCEDFEYVVTNCTSSTNVECARCIECSDTEFETRECDGIHNRVCQSCRLCPVGQEMSVDCTSHADRECQDCETGKYKDSAGNVACTTCSDTCGQGQWTKTFCTKETNRECRECTQCDPGYYVSTQCANTYDTICSICSDGTFSEDGNECKPCRDCPYSSIEMSSCSKTADTKCEPCPPNMTSAVGSYACLCAAGFTEEDGNCTACSDTTYKTTPGPEPCFECQQESGMICSESEYLILCGGKDEGKCETCPPGSTSPSGSISREDCKCALGEGVDLTGGCSPCELGNYKSELNLESCSPCPESTTTEHTSSVNISECVCPPGRYSDSVSCEACPIGMYNPEFNHNCTSCPVNETTLYTGTVNASDCQCRPNSWYCDGNANCEHECCSKFAEMNLAVNRYQCRDFYCPYAQYVSGDLECSPCGDCPAGEYRIGCADAAETLNSGGRCDPCATGTFKTTSGSGLCDDCNHMDPVCGSYQIKKDCGIDDPGVCEDCEAGKYYLAGTCENCGGCPVGKYRDNCGLSSVGTCLSCDAGTYKTSTGSEACESCTVWDFPCQAGKFLNGCGADSAGTCESCSGCPAGEYLVNCTGSDAGSCQSCDVGTYKDSSGSEPCQSCDGLCLADAVVVGCGGSSSGTCESCPDGQYVDAGVCTPCPGCAAGEYRVNCLGASAGSCQTCLSGTYKTSTGSESCLSCDECDFDELKIGCGGDSQGTCKTCEEHMIYQGVCATGGGCLYYIASGSNSVDQKSCEPCLRNPQDADFCGVDMWLEGCGGNESGTCQNCSANKYSSGWGIYNEAQCLSCITCAGNTERVGCSGTSAGTCNTCSSGKYSDTGVCTDCQDCGNGYYLTGCGTEDNGHYEGVCMACSAVCPGNKVLTGCGGTEPGSCEDCPSGTYKDGDSCVSCAPCPDGETRYDCGVDVGGDLSGECRSCLSGFYKGQGDDSCQPCPQQFSESPAGSTHWHNCSCLSSDSSHADSFYHGTFYRIGDVRDPVLPEGDTYDASRDQCYPNCSVTSCPVGEGLEGCVPYHAYTDIPYQSGTPAADRGSCVACSATSYKGPASEYEIPSQTHWDTCRTCSGRNQECLNAVDQDELKSLKCNNQPGTCNVGCCPPVDNAVCTGPVDTCWFMHNAIVESCGPTSKGTCTGKCGKMGTECTIASDDTVAYNDYEACAPYCCAGSASVPNSWFPASRCSRVY